MGSDETDIVLDFFAGSGSTAHAIMSLNEEDQASRKFILVQLPEPCHENSEAFKKGYTNITDICIARLKKSGEKIKDKRIDVGFRFLRIDESNMRDIYYQPNDLKSESLDMFVDSIKDNRSHQDLLFQVILESGLELSVKIDTVNIMGKTIFVVDNAAIVACFDQQLSGQIIKKVAELGPIRAVFRDDGFLNDSSKVNAEQIIKQISPTTEVRVI